MSDTTNGRNTDKRLVCVFPTRKLDGLAVDDEVGQLLGDLPTLLLVLRQVELLAQLYVKHLQGKVDIGHGQPRLQFTCFHLLSRSKKMYFLSVSTIKKVQWSFSYSS